MKQTLPTIALAIASVLTLGGCGENRKLGANEQKAQDQLKKEMESFKGAAAEAQNAVAAVTSSQTPAPAATK